MVLILKQDAFCANLVENIYDIYLERDEYDMRELMPDPFPYAFYVLYLNTPEVQKAIGAYQNYTESNNAVYYAFTATGRSHFSDWLYVWYIRGNEWYWQDILGDDNREAGTIGAIRKLLKQGINVVLYAGDADYNCE